MKSRNGQRRGRGKVKEEETLIINEGQTTSEEVNQKDLKIVVISMEEVET
jgi:hypothetical protein